MSSLLENNGISLNVELWDSKGVYFGMSDRASFTVIMMGLIFVSYYMHGWFFVMADWYGFLDKYQIRERKATMEKQFLAIKEASIDVLIMKPVLIYAINYYDICLYIGMGRMEKELPDLSKMFLDWVLLESVFSLAFFLGHMVLHTEWLYLNIHKVHHSIHDSVAFGAIYIHPVENLTNFVYMMAPIAIVKPHFLTYCVFVFSRHWEIIDSHSGYEVPWNFLYCWSSIYPWACGASMHDYHHSHNVGCYGGGILNIFDKMIGSDKKYLDFVEKNKKKSAGKKST